MEGDKGTEAALRDRDERPLAIRHRWHLGKLEEPRRRMGAHFRDTDDAGQRTRWHDSQEYRFKRGQTGNPKGAKKKKNQTLAPAIAEILKKALAKRVKLTQGDKTRIVSMAEVGIEQLVAQFAKGDRHARRDVMMLADKFGVNFTESQIVKEALAPNDQAILDRYVARKTNLDASLARERVIAPPDLLDDDES
jgi:Family of unknown function (DUF5681)